jgi:hypothetical protein
VADWIRFAAVADGIFNGLAAEERTLRRQHAGHVDAVDERDERRLVIFFRRVVLKPRFGRPEKRFCRTSRRMHKM